MAALTLRLLGTPSVLGPEGNPLVPQPGAKPLGLLAYLAIEPGPHSREELASLLWGESSEAEARASLRQAIKQLRACLGPMLRAERDTVELATPVPCDLLEYRRVLSEDPHRAIGYDVSRFMSGLSIRGAPRFEEWLAQTRRELLRGHHEALGTLARQAMGEWRWREAADLAERWLAGDPLCDEAVKLVVEARYLAGDRGAALARFSEYRNALKQETGCEPSRALIGLARRIETDLPERATRPVTDEWYLQAPRFEASLIGREQEWNTLVEAWRESVRGVGRVVLIQGDAGVGKSRLGDEFVHWVVTERGTVLRGRADDGPTGAPYEPVAELLQGVLNAPGLGGAAPEWLAEAARLIPDLHQRFPGLPTPVAMEDSAQAWRLFEGFAQVLLALAAERPVVAFLDDLQWCDNDGCKLLRFLIRRSERAPILWIVTVNVSELEPEGPAVRLYRVLRTRPNAVLVTPGPLSEAQLTLMIRQMGHLTAPSGGRRFTRRLFEVTAGNPFYVIELLKTMFARGVLTAQGEGGQWTATAVAGAERHEFSISQGVHDVISERVERLPDPMRHVLVTIAVAASPCSSELLSRIHGIPRLHAAALADALVERRLADESGGSYRSSHPVIARVVRDRLTPARRREIHRSLALTLVELASGDNARDEAGEIARHADRGGERALAYRYARRACETAMERFAYGEALAWLEIAGRNSEGEAQDSEVKQVKQRVVEAAASETLPVARLGGPITRGLEPEDFDLL